MVSLRTKNLLLEPINFKHTEALFHILHKHKSITQYLTFDPPEKTEETEKFVKIAIEDAKKKTDFVWVINKESTPVGVVGLHNIKQKKLAWQYDNATLGYWLNPEYRQQGIVSEAAQTIVNYGFMELKLHKIIAEHLTGNIGSEKVIQKLGFNFVGEHKSHMFRYNRWWDYKIWELLHEDWNRNNG